MITFGGIEVKNNISYIIFYKNKAIIKIPIESISAERIKLYLRKITEPVILNRNNIEEEK